MPSSPVLDYMQSPQGEVYRRAFLAFFTDKLGAPLAERLMAIEWGGLKLALSLKDLLASGEVVSSSVKYQQPEAGFLRWGEEPKSLLLENIRIRFLNSKGSLESVLLSPEDIKEGNVSKLSEDSLSLLKNVLDAYEGLHEESKHTFHLLKMDNAAVGSLMESGSLPDVYATLQQKVYGENIPLDPEKPVKTPKI